MITVVTARLLADQLELAELTELKLVAGWPRDESDVVELLRANPDRVQQIRQHLAPIYPQYVAGSWDRTKDKAAIVPWMIAPFPCLFVSSPGSV